MTNDWTTMFGNYSMHPGGGVNPVHSPAYPMEWDARIRMLEVLTKVDAAKIDEILKYTPFERINDRVAFRFMLSPWHTISLWQGEMFDLMVTIPVHYQGLSTQTHIFMYCSDAMGIAAGRELFGYTKKECTYKFRESSEGHIDGWVTRRGVPLARFDFEPDPAAPIVRLIDGPSQPHGEVHVRRIPHPAKPEPVYADVVYRDTPINWSQPVGGRIEWELIASEFDPLTDLEPEVLSAQFLHTDVFGGGFDVEDRRLMEVLATERGQ